jgi:predicted nucleotidyltransferase
MADRPSIDDLARVREQILAVAARHGAGNVRVFGSVARGDADAASDIDFLVDFQPGRSLLDLAGVCSTWPDCSWISRTCLVIQSMWSPNQA